MSLQWTPSSDHRWAEVAAASISTSACSPGVRVLDSLIGEEVAGAESLSQYHRLAYKAVKSDSWMNLSAVTGGQRYSLALPTKIGITCFVISVSRLVNSSGLTYLHSKTRIFRG